MERRKVQSAIDNAVAHLMLSDRGRDIVRDLYLFMKGRYGGADGQNQDVVIGLLATASAGYLPNVLEALFQARKEVLHVD